MIILIQELRAEIERLQAENQELTSAKHTLECRFEVSEDTLSCIRGCLRAAEGDIDRLKAENAELKAQAGKAVGPLTIGIRGKAYDPPGTHRAYTYAEQPDDVGAWRLGAALVEAHAAPAGDHIDGGLGLLKALQLRGYGVFEMDQVMTKEQP